MNAPELRDAFLALEPSLLLWAKLLSLKNELRSLYISAVKTCHIWFVSTRGAAIPCPTVAFNLAIQVYIDTGLGFSACIITNEEIYLMSSLVGHSKYFQQARMFSGNQCHLVQSQTAATRTIVHIKPDTGKCRFNTNEIASKTQHGQHMLDLQRPQHEGCKHWFQEALGRDVSQLIHWVASDSSFHPGPQFERWRDWRKPVLWPLPVLLFLSPPIITSATYGCTPECGTQTASLTKNGSVYFNMQVPQSHTQTY